MHLDDNSAANQHTCLSLTGPHTMSLQLSQLASLLCYKLTVSGPDTPRQVSWWATDAKMYGSYAPHSPCCRAELAASCNAQVDAYHQPMGRHKMRQATDKTLTCKKWCLACKGWSA